MERRCHPRKSVDLSIIYYYLPADHPKTKMLDLSQSGAAIEALDPFPVGAALAFGVIVGELYVECRAQVIYTMPLAPCRFRVGVQFTGLAPAEQAILFRTLQNAPPLTDVTSA